MKKMKRVNSARELAKLRYIDGLVDRFVAKVNSSYREPIMVEIYEAPPSVLVGEPDEHGEFDWMIKPYANIDWVEPLEEKLGHRFPAAYRSLITRYIFPGFEFGNILFFGNTPEGTEYYELRERIFCDPSLYETLLPGNFIEFGKPDSVDYDPVCLDMNRKSDDDCPIVQIDHHTYNIVGQLAPSFTKLLESIVDAG